MAERSKGRLADVAFDIRTVIGALFAVYGVVCLVWGLVSFSAADSRKTGGINLNLWTGIGMVVVAAAFITWTLARPIHPDDDPEAREAAAAAAEEEGR
jgi:drug/metabolite transporter (DMT)-like permease